MLREVASEGGGSQSFPDVTGEVNIVFGLVLRKAVIVNVVSGVQEM